MEGNIYGSDLLGSHFSVWLSCSHIEDVTSLTLFLKYLSLSSILTEFVWVLCQEVQVFLAILPLKLEPPVTILKTVGGFSLLEGWVFKRG